MTGVDIKLEPVTGSTSGELFKLRGSNITMTIDGEILDYDNIMTISDGDNILFRIPIRNIRYITCYK